MEAPIGLVLAGGAGRRLGRAKGAVLVSGKSLAVRAAETLAPACAGVLVSVRPGGPNPAPGYPAVEDGAPAGRGPLAGIAAAFAGSTVADLLVLACDYPRVGTPMLRAIVDRASGTDLTLVRDPAGRDHPLVALWSRRTQAAVNEALARGAYRVGDLVQRLDVCRLEAGCFPGIDLAAALANVNRPEDLAALDGPA